MKILFLSTENPFPPDHGHHIRTLNVLKHLSVENDIYFIGFAKSKKEQEHTNELARYCKSVELFLLPWSKSRLRLIATLLKSCLLLMPFSALRYFTKDAATKIIALLNIIKLMLYILICCILLFIKNI